MKKILIALDYEPSAEIIAKTGHNLAKAIKAETILLHVIPEPGYYSSLKYSPILGFEALSAVNIVETDSESELLKVAEDFLQTKKYKLKDNSIATLIKVGELAENILMTAEDIKADMVVIGTHRKNGIKKILSGSVAEQIFHHSQVPVLIIPVESIE